MAALELCWMTFQYQNNVHNVLLLLFCSSQRAAMVLDFRASVGESTAGAKLSAGFCQHPHPQMWAAADYGNTNMLASLI